MDFAAEFALAPQVLFPVQMRLARSELARAPAIGLAASESEIVAEPARTVSSSLAA
jgi:hypothetical protein